jgi:hypothetical protein
MAAVAASREGGGGLAFGRRKEKRERASAGPKGRSGRRSHLDWKERWAGLDQKWAG